MFAVVFGIARVADSELRARRNKPDNSQDKHLDIHSSWRPARGQRCGRAKAGLPLYPGARVHRDEDNEQNESTMGVLTEAFGLKLVVAKYESDDAPGKVIDFYRDKLKKYGKVIECHTREHGGTHAEL